MLATLSPKSRKTGDWVRRLLRLQMLRGSDQLFCRNPSRGTISLHRTEWHPYNKLFVERLAESFDRNGICSRAEIIAPVHGRPPDFVAKEYRSSAGANSYQEGTWPSLINCVTTNGTIGRCRPVGMTGSPSTGYLPRVLAVSHVSKKAPLRLRAREQSGFPGQKRNSGCETL